MNKENWDEWGEATFWNYKSSKSSRVIILKEFVITHSCDIVKLCFQSGSCLVLSLCPIVLSFKSVCTCSTAYIRPDDNTHEQIMTSAGSLVKLIYLKITIIALSQEPKSKRKRRWAFAKKCSTKLKSRKLRVKKNRRELCERGRGVYKMCRLAKTTKQMNSRKRNVMICVGRLAS